MGYKLLSKLFYQSPNDYIATYNNRFNSEGTYHFNIKVNGNEAFCVLNQEIMNLCTEISSTDKLITVIASQLPHIAINQFATKSLVDEIILTNDIEGVYSTRKEINLILQDAKKHNKKRRFDGLVNKYKMLNISELSLKTCKDIRNIYDELVLPEVLEDDPDNNPDGILFRKDMAEVITSTGKIIHHGIYPEEKITDYMEQALKIVNNEDIPALIRIAVFHYLFGYIHPFYDGNGRTSRFISSYLLAQKFEYLIGYRLSYTIKENINEYYEAFKICNDEKNKADLTPFVIMFLKIINKSLDNLLSALYNRQNDLDKYKSIIDNIEGIDHGIAFILLQSALFSRLGASREEICNTQQIGLTTLAKKLKIIDEAGYLVVKKNGNTKYYSFNIEKL